MIGRDIRNAAIQPSSDLKLARLVERIRGALSRIISGQLCMVLP